MHTRDVNQSNVIVLVDILLMIIYVTISIRRAKVQTVIRPLLKCTGGELCQITGARGGSVAADSNILCSDIEQTS